MELSGLQRDANDNHIRVGCECRVVQAPVQRIKAIDEQGEIPLLRMTTGDTDKLDLAARRYDVETRYVVISPTWPNAIASSADNTIPTCQLIRIADRLGKLQVEEVHDTLYFWLEPLCIPAERYRHGHRTLQPARKVDIYNRAYAILALDRQFLSLNGLTKHDELVARLRDAEWIAQSRQFIRGSSTGGILLITSIGVVDLRGRLKASVLQELLAE